MPSCYKALQIDNPNPVVEKELFILVDQTTQLDKKLMIYTYKNMMKFIKNGYAVTIASFSSNANGKYTDVPYSGKLETLSKLVSLFGTFSAHSQKDLLELFCFTERR